jgi:nucleotide-binding universal stress UspA family protein
MKLAADGTRAALDAGLAAKPEIAEVAYQGTCHAILDAANQHDAGLIVLGKRGLSTFQAFVLGSVSHGVAQQAHRPVLIVPPAMRAETAGAPTEHATAAS